MGTPGMVIIGAGEAGGRASTELRECGYSGEITVIGAEPHAPYERPPLSKSALTSLEEPAPKHSLDSARCAARRITHHARALVVWIDRAEHRIALADGRQIPYERLLITTGARPRRLNVPGAEHAIYLRTFADALALRRLLEPGVRLAVIGGGFIGLEVTASAIKRGGTVTLIEAAPRLLMRGVPADIAERVRQRHEQAGVAIHTDAVVERIQRDGPTFVVRLADGAPIECDALIAGIGAVPETTLAEQAGLAVENGIAVDATLRTEDADIFAAGDCCSFPHVLYGNRRIRLEAWRNAQDQGAAVARSMLGSADPYTAVPWFWSDQYDDTLQIAGLPDEGQRVVRRHLGGAEIAFHLADDGRLVAASGIGPNATIAREVRLAEMLIAARATPAPAALTDSAVKLKSLLRG